ncbi:ABC transporter permease [Phytohabitans flavus]|uniref:ABC transporter permease n=1 Tax=Phytohabitans flavus TaxID=1076124 RepID=A0A6F8XTM0_9ACTN|nr:ABC transporter permease [Phytohabitans flavus]BCB77175.1 ABC transporter permease [Phytohabitans flavus]
MTAVDTRRVPAARTVPGGFRWGRFVARRALRLVVLLCGVAVAAFSLMMASPVDPVRAYVGAEVTRLGPEQRAVIEETWGFNDPPLTRFLAWAREVVQGNLGDSIVFNQPVVDVIAERFLTSLALMIAAWSLSAVLGFGMGLLAGYFRGRWVDRVLTWWAYTLASAPTFWVALLLLYVFAVALRVAPVCCAVPIGAMADEVTIWDRLHHLILPAVALSIVGVAPIVLHTRQAVVEALASDHVAFARAQGERGWGLVRHRILRNACAPALMLSFASFGELFGGSILAEQVFSYPGLGEATTTAALRQDVPLLLGIALFTTVFVFIGNLLGDVIHRLVDPRVSLDGAR